MLRTDSTNISIITNFGCDHNCWYCIWRGHTLENVRPETDWDKLRKFLEQNMHIGKVSVSGGGDPLYHYNYNKKWWEKLFNITGQLGMLVDVHTRTYVDDKWFWNKINLCAFSTDELMDDIKSIADIRMTNADLRLVHLITKNTTITTINRYLEYKNYTGCQLTMKQLFRYDDNGMYHVIKKRFPENQYGIHYIDRGDYNVYYMPDNTISDKFLFKKKEYIIHDANKIIS